MSDQCTNGLQTKTCSVDARREMSGFRQEVVPPRNQLSTIIMFACAFILAAENAAAQDMETRSFKRTDYILQKDIQASDGYVLNVGKGGVVRLTSVRSEQHPNKRCMIDRRALRPLLRKAIQGSAASAIQVEIKLVNCPSGTPANTVCCSGAGAGCKLDVIVLQRPSGHSS